MAAPSLSVGQLAEALKALEEHGSQIKAAEALGISRATFQHRLNEARRRLDSANLSFDPVDYPHRFPLSIRSGTVVVFSDSHYWPNHVSTAHLALVRFLREFEGSIKAIVNNGDALDGSSISRHPPIGWESRPSLVDEIEACKERLAEIERAAPNATRIWNLGNHDSRYETRLATVAPEYARIHGVHLKDHFPYWHPAWSTWINDSVVVKHRHRFGVHAAYNNTLSSGKTIVTGHTHSMKATPWNDYNGVRWGVECGTLADPDGPQFIDYTEDGPKNWRSGFAVLTFFDSELLWPEFVHVMRPGFVEFRGKVYEV